MCVYCQIADWARNYIPPTYPPYTPPYSPTGNWNLPMWQELQEILRRVKALEDKVGDCPCPDGGKLAYLGEIKEKLDFLVEKEKKLEDEKEGLEESLRADFEKGRIGG